MQIVARDYRFSFDSWSIEDGVKRLLQFCQIDKKIGPIAFLVLGRRSRLGFFEKSGEILREPAQSVTVRRIAFEVLYRKLRERFFANQFSKNRKIGFQALDQPLEIGVRINRQSLGAGLLNRAIDDLL